MERRIAAVLAADMVGFSRLVELDEIGTLQRQKRHLRELIEPTIQAKHGHIIKLTGDGLLAEFASVVEAVQTAVAVQTEMAAREEDQPDDQKILYRVGIHLGDVVFDEGDVYGDGVNVAARLEALAEPGGVVISGTAYDVLKTNVDVAYKSLGEKHLKNIATPVRVYQVVEGKAVLPSSPMGNKRIGLFASGAFFVVALLALYLWISRADSNRLDTLMFELSQDIENEQYLAAEATIDLIEREILPLETPDQERTLSSLADKVLLLGSESGFNRNGRRALAGKIFSTIKNNGSFPLQYYFLPDALSGKDLVAIDFSNIEVDGMSFSGAFLIFSSFDGSTITNVDFTNAKLRSVSFFGTKFDDVDFRNTDWFNAFGISVDEFSGNELDKLQQCPGEIRDFTSYFGDHYFYEFGELPDDLKEALIENWSVYTSKGGLCDLVRRRSD